MRQDVVDAKLNRLMTHDWRSEAAQILEERKKGNETQGGDQVGIFEL